LVSINDTNVLLQVEESNTPQVLDNDLAYIFAGGELPTAFLKKAGVEITKRFGYVVKTYK
jgi:hypothetical protein